MSRPVPSAVLARIAAAAQRTEVGFTDDPAEVAELRALTVRAMEIEIDTPRTFRESVELFRIGRREVEANPDGLEFHGPTFEAMRLFGLFTRQAASDPESTAFQQGRTATTAPIDTAVAHIWTVTPDNARASQIAAGRDWPSAEPRRGGRRRRVPPAQPGAAGISRDGGDPRRCACPLRPGWAGRSRCSVVSATAPRSGRPRAGPSRPRYGRRDPGRPLAIAVIRQPAPARGGWAGGAAGRGGPCTPRAAPLPIARHPQPRGFRPWPRPSTATPRRLSAPTGWRATWPRPT